MKRDSTQKRLPVPGFPVLVFVFLVLFLPFSLSAQDWTKEQKTAAANLVGIAGVTAWGVANWDYFGNSPKTADEGWFNKDTAEGGARSSLENP